MGLFDFFKGDSKKTSIDLTDFKFISDNHTRLENGRPTNANNRGAWRGIRVTTSDSTTFFVTMFNMNENHPVWGNNIQMAEKRMKRIADGNDKIVLRGFGTDAMGASFADYGLTLHHLNGNIDQITLHMHDRNIDIVYDKAESKKPAEPINRDSGFENFKNFTHRWNTNLSIQDKMQIAMKSDAINNQGVELFDEGDFLGASKYFEQALALMPNNDDALKNLKICYTEIGDLPKAVEMKKRLDYLS